MDLILCQHQFSASDLTILSQSLHPGTSTAHTTNLESRLMYDVCARDSKASMFAKAFILIGSAPLGKGEQKRELNF